MTASDLTLNIAVNLGRTSRWAMEGKENRIRQFLDETEKFVTELENAPKKKEFLHTFEKFKSDFVKLKNNIALNADWAESMLTWANILTHRAKLA